MEDVAREDDGTGGWIIKEGAKPHSRRGGEYSLVLGVKTRKNRRYLAIVTSSFQIIPEEFLKVFYADQTTRRKSEENRTSKNSSRPLARKVLLGNLGRGKNSSKSALGYLG